MGKGVHRLSYKGLKKEISKSFDITGFENAFSNGLCASQCLSQFALVMNVYYIWWLLKKPFLQLLLWVHCVFPVNQLFVNFTWTFTTGWDAVLCPCSSRKARDLPRNNLMLTGVSKWQPPPIPTKHFFRYGLRLAATISVYLQVDIHRKLLQESQLKVMALSQTNMHIRWIRSKVPTSPNHPQKIVRVQKIS